MNDNEEMIRVTLTMHRNGLLKSTLAQVEGIDRVVARTVALGMLTQAIAVIGRQVEATYESNTASPGYKENGTHPATVVGRRGAG